MESNRQAEELGFIEEVGVVFEQTGLPRMAGRVLGWLLISDPPYQSPDELAGILMASKGSISTMARLLMQIGLIERFGMPGVRHGYFRLRQDAWRHMIGHGLGDEIQMFRQVAEHGLELVKSKPSTSRKWLEEMRAVYAFLETELPLLLQRWEKERRKDQLGGK